MAYLKMLKQHSKLRRRLQTIAIHTKNEHHLTHRELGPSKRTYIVSVSTQFP